MSEELENNDGTWSGLKKTIIGEGIVTGKQIGRAHV